MSLQVRGIDRDDVRFGLACHQAAEYSMKDAHSRPADEAAVKGLVRSIDFRRIPPSQTIADDVDNTAVIDMRPAQVSWEAGSDTSS